jgi:hypothetical protein
VKLTDELKSEIDSKSYEDLLRRWRHGPIGDPIFQDDSGQYWAKRMAELRAKVGGDAVHTAASKTIGW